jgi:hypothetical protein
LPLDRLAAFNLTFYFDFLWRIKPFLMFQFETHSHSQHYVNFTMLLGLLRCRSAHSKSDIFTRQNKHSKKMHKSKPLVGLKVMIPVVKKCFLAGEHSSCIRFLLQCDRLFTVFNVKLGLAYNKDSSEGTDFSDYKFLSN